MNTTPRPFQAEDAKLAWEKFSGRCLVAEPVGSGKSMTALLVAYQHVEARPILVVCPAGLKYNWAREAMVHFNWRAEILNGVKPEKTTSGWGLPKELLIVSYEILYAWVDMLTEYAPNLVILDEVHRVSNPKARMTKVAKALCRRIPYMIGLSGTPLVNRPADLWPVLNMLRPDLYPSRWAFYHAFCNMKRTPFGTWDYRGASNLGELNKRLVTEVMIRRKKEDILKDLPPIQTNVISIPLADRMEYDKAEDDFISWLCEQDSGKLCGAVRAIGKTKLMTLRQLIGMQKVPAVGDWVESFLAESDDKLILYAVHLAVIREFYDRFKGRCVTVTGKVRGKKRQLCVDQFLGNKKTRLLIGQVKAAGEGWSAKGVADVAFAEYPWHPAGIEQCIGRCHGISRGIEGQHTTGHFLVAYGSVEDKQLALIDRKRKVIAAAIDGAEAGEDFSMFDELVTLLRAGRKEGFCVAS